MDNAPSKIDSDFVKEVERHHFRTEHDTGANLNAMLVWNIVRKHVGLPPLSKKDLPRYCVHHDTYHLLRPDYGCRAQS